MFRRLVLLLTVAVAVVGLSASPAAAQQYPPGGPTTVSDTTVVPGQSVSITSPGWLPGSTEDIDFLSVPVNLGKAVANALGVVSTTVRIPADATPGDHFLRLTGRGADGNPREIQVHLVVLGAAADEFAFTGASIRVWMVLAFAFLVAAGAFAIRAARRRAQRAAMPR